MHNIDKVTKYIRKNCGGRGARILNAARFLIIKTVTGELYTIDPDGDYWRAYNL